MAIIDPHHHLWDLSRLDYPWINSADKTAFYGDYSGLATNYQVEDYLADSADWCLAASVHIQAEASPIDPVAETRWLTEMADRSGGVPHRIVAYADFTRADVEDVLAAHCRFGRVCGIRQILNYHRDPSFSYTSENLLDNDSWRANFSLLEKFGLSFDLQIYHQQMVQAAQLATMHPNIQIILNHTGMPVERAPSDIDDWRAGMERLAQCPNVAVKISGLGMCDPHWTVDSIRPFVLDTIDRFGVERCMFASNFPVDGLFSSFGRLYSAYAAIVSSFSGAQRVDLLHDNAARYYRIP